MIIECPNCGTKYAVREEAIKPRGRTVRCANCGEQWHADGSAPVVLDRTAEETFDPDGAFPEDRGEPARPPSAHEDEPEPDGGEARHVPFETGTEDEPHTIAATPELRHESGAKSEPKLATLGLLAASFLIIVIGVIAAQGPLTRAWPASERLYRLAGLSVPAAGVGLDLRDVHAVLETDPKGKGLTVQATVANTMAIDRDVPMLAATLVLDSDTSDPGQGHPHMFAAPASKLPPQGTVEVKASFDVVGGGPGKVVLTFAPDNKQQSK